MKIIFCIALAFGISGLFAPRANAAVRTTSTTPKPTAVTTVAAKPPVSPVKKTTTVNK